MAQELFFDITMSLDGYIAGPHDGLDHPIGIDGEQLHEWVVQLKSWREVHGLDGGIDSDAGRDLHTLIDSTGATLMGHRMFEMGEPSWGDNPPFHQPVFILTHHPRDPITMGGGTTYHFVTDGPGRALELAREAAGEKHVHIAGGATCVQQYLNAGLVDHFTVHIAPILLRSGVRLFDDDATGAIRLTPETVREDGGWVHVHYRYPRA
jgi:dihydrofolate reductase